MNEVTQIAPYISVVTMTVGLVQAVKYADQEDRFRRFLPLISMVIGFVLSLVLFHLDPIVALVTGLAASGTYEVGKRTILGQIAPAVTTTQTTTKVTSTSATPTAPAETVILATSTPAVPVPPPMGTNTPSA